MSTEYEKEMFDFFTQPANFETMLKVADQSESIKKELVTQFWEGVRIEIESVLSKSDTDWQVNFSDNWDARYNKLWIYKDEWRKGQEYPMASVAFEHILSGDHPYVGIHIGYDCDRIDGTQLKEDFKTKELLAKYKTDRNNYWAVWKHTKIDLWENESMIKLLPENRKTTIKNTVGEA